MLDDFDAAAKPGVSGPQIPPGQIQQQAPAAVPLPKAESAADAISIEVLRPSSGETPPKSAPVQTTHEVAKQQDIADTGKAGRSLGKVARTVLKMLSARSDTAKAYLDSRIAEHESNVRYIQSEIAKTIEHSRELRESPAYRQLADHQANPANARTPLEIPQAMLDKAVHLKKKVGSKKKVAQRAVEAGVHRNIADKEIRGVGTMKAYRFEGESSITTVENEVTPTSFKLGKKGAKDSLTNVYVIMVDGKKYGVIRTGVINSKQRANEFLHLLKQMHGQIQADNPNFKKMRVLSHQLNSYENEGSKLIKPQHQWIAHVNKQMKDEGLGEVAHIDTSSNAFYTYAAKHPSTLGKILSGERHTKEMNVDGWGTYMGWVAEDLDPTTIATKMREDEDPEVGNAVDKLFKENSELARQMSSISGKPKLSKKSKIPEASEREKCASKIADSLAEIAEKTETLKGLKTKSHDQIQELNRLKALLKDKEKQLPSMQGKYFQEEIQKDIIKSLKADIEAREKEIPDKNALKEEAADVKRTAAQLKKEIAYAGKVVKEERQKMNGILREDHEKLAALESHLQRTIKVGKSESTTDEEWAIQNQVLQDALEKTTLMRQVLGSQLSIPGKVLDRGQEGMAIQLLNIKLGITSQMNCKSGIDRTGLWHAIRVSMDELVAQAKGNTADLFAMVSDWSNITNEMHKKMKDHGEATFLNWIMDKSLPNESLPEGEHLQKIRKEKANSCNVVEFRKLVLKNLLTLGLDVTQASTLFSGAKYHIGTMQENTTPLNFLPPSVTIGGKTHQLVKHDSSGRPSGFDQSGADLIEGLSTERGS